MKVLEWIGNAALIVDTRNAPSPAGFRAFSYARLRCPFWLGETGASPTSWLGGECQSGIRDDALVWVALVSRAISRDSTPPALVFS